MTPDPTLPDVVEAFKKGEIKEFERHSRLGFVDHAGFLNIGEWLKAGTLPKTVSKFGAKADEIFVSYEELKAKYGKDVEKLPAQ